MIAEWFLDTSYVIALVFAADRHHARAVALSRHIRAGSIRVVTTQAVLFEIGNSLSKIRYRPQAVQLLTELENDALVSIVPLNESLYAEAFDLYRNRPDKEWGLVDCLSFVVMTKRGLTDALTADEHFEQAGFRALLRHDLP